MRGISIISKWLLYGIGFTTLMVNLSTIIHYSPLFSTILHYYPLLYMIIHYYPLLETIIHYTLLYTIRLSMMIFSGFGIATSFFARRAADVMWDCRKQLWDQPIVGSVMLISPWWSHQVIPWAWFVIIRWRLLISWLMSDVYWKRILKNWWQSCCFPAFWFGNLGWFVKNIPGWRASLLKCWQEIPAEHAVKLLEARSSFPAICLQQFVLGGFEYKQNHTRSVWAYLFGVSKPP